METTKATNTPPGSWKLVIACLLWFLITLITLAVLVVALPVRLSYISEVLAPGMFGDVPGPFGITVEFVAGFITTGEIIFGFLIWFTVGALVF